MSGRRAEYVVPYSHPDAVDPTNYAGCQPLVPCRLARVGPIDLRIPESFRGRGLLVRIIVEAVP